VTFPVIANSATSLEDASNVTSHTVSLPPNISSGDLLIVIFGVDGGPSVTWPGAAGDWNEIVSWSGGGAVRLHAAWRDADGTEGGSITVTTSNGQRSAHCAYRITGHEDPATQPPQGGLGATGTNAAPDPPSRTPSGGAKDYLWIACHANDRDRTTTAYPTNYDKTQLTTSGSGANSCGVAAAGREFNFASENPGPFTISAADDWAAATVAVHPASGAAAYSITGDVTVTPSVAAATLDYTRNAALAGAVTVSAQVGATMAYARHYAIAGAVLATPSVAAVLAFNQHPSLAGAVTVAPSVAAALGYTLNAAISGAVTVTPSVAATLDYTRNAALSGAVTVTPTVAAGMAFQGSNTIAGDVTVTPTVAGGMTFNRHAAIAGAVAVAPQVAAGLALTIRRFLAGNIVLGVTPAALGLVHAGHGSIVERTNLAGEVRLSEMAGTSGPINLSGKVA
jgi:hypothetical protein